MKRYTHMLAGFTFIAVILVATNAVAAESSGIIAVYDENAYTEQMKNSMGELDKLYLQFNDKSLPAGKAQKAKREYFRIARALLVKINDRLDKLDPRTGAALSHTEMLYTNHLQIMLLDMLANIHQSEWLAGDEAY